MNKDLYHPSSKYNNDLFTTRNVIILENENGDYREITPIRKISQKNTSISISDLNTDVVEEVVGDRQNKAILIVTYDPNYVTGIKIVTKDRYGNATPYLPISGKEWILVVLDPSSPNWPKDPVTGQPIPKVPGQVVYEVPLEENETKIDIIYYGPIVEVKELTIVADVIYNFFVLLRFEPLIFTKLNNAVVGRDLDTDRLEAYAYDGRHIDNDSEQSILIHIIINTENVNISFSNNDSLLFFTDVDNIKRGLRLTNGKYQELINIPSNPSLLDTLDSVSHDGTLVYCASSLNQKFYFLKNTVSTGVDYNIQKEDNISYYNGLAIDPSGRFITYTSSDKSQIRLSRINIDQLDLKYSYTRSGNPLDFRPIRTMWVTSSLVIDVYFENDECKVNLFLFSLITETIDLIDTKTLDLSQVYEITSENNLVLIKGFNSDLNEKENILLKVRAETPYIEITPLDTTEIISPLLSPEQDIFYSVDTEKLILVRYLVVSEGQYIKLLN